MTDQSEISDLPAMEDSNMILEHVPQISSDIKAITTNTDNKKTTTEKSSKNVSKMVIDDKVMLDAESEYKMKENNDNETINDCQIVEEYLEDIFDEEPVTDDVPLASTVKSDLEASIEKTFISNTVANKIANQKQPKERTKIESVTTRHNPSEIKVFAYNSSINKVKKPAISLLFPIQTASDKETKQTTAKKGNTVDKEVFQKFYASNTPFKEKFNNIQRDLVYENSLSAVYIGHDRDKDDSNTGKSNNEATSAGFGVKTGYQGSSDEHKIQSCKNKLNNIVQDFVDHFATIMNYKWYNNQDVLIYGRNGTAMVLLHEAKYIAMKEIITGKKIPNLLAPKEKPLDPSSTKIMNERNKVEEYLKKCQDEVKILRNENDIYEKEYCALKIKIRRLEEEMKDLRMLKEDLGKIYTPAQIRMMTPHRRNRVNWTDDDIKKAIILYQMVGVTAYKYIKMQLKFPLPSLGALNRWNKDKKNSNLKLTRKRTARNETSHDDVTQEENLKSEVQHEKLLTSTLNTSDEVMVPAEINDSTECQEADMITNDPGSLVQNDGELLYLYMNEENPDEQYYILGDESTIDSNHVNIVKTEGDDSLQIDDNILEPSGDKKKHDNKPTVSKYSKWELDGLDNYEKGKVGIEDRHNWKLNCKLCMKPNDNEEQLRQHVQTHYLNTYYTPYLDAETPFVCEFCNEEVKNRDIIIRHHILHLGITEFKCWHPGCTYVAKNKVCLTEHIGRHLPRRHLCPKCSAAFSKRKQLREHYARKHSARQRHICQLCSAKCLSDYTFHLHLESHKKPPTYKCQKADCSESFYCRRDLLDHGAQHGDNTRQQYKCELCPLATFSQAIHLKRHKEYHKNFKISHCGKCQKIFESYTDYYMHIATYHKVTCVCSRSFRCKSKLIRHQSECRLVRESNKDTSNKHDEESNEEILPTASDYISQVPTLKQDTSMDQIEITDNFNMSDHTMKQTQIETKITGKRAVTIKLEHISQYPNKKQKLVMTGEVPETIITIPKQRVQQKFLEQNSNNISKRRIIMINKSDHSEIIKQENSPWSESVVQTSEYSQQETDNVIPGTSFQPDMPHIDL